MGFDEGVHWWEQLYVDIAKVHCYMRWRVGVLG
jgi:hypothetical protein